MRSCTLSPIQPAVSLSTNLSIVFSLSSEPGSISCVVRPTDSELGSGVECVDELCEQDCGGLRGKEKTPGGVGGIEGTVRTEAEGL